MANTLINLRPYSIEHVGSTSVPRLAAKPVIDVDIVVRDSELEPIKAALTSNSGYVYEDMGVPLSHAFQESAAVPTSDLYVCVEGC